MIEKKKKLKQHRSDDLETPSSGTRTTNEFSCFKKIINLNCHFKPGVALGCLLDSHDTGKATIIQGGPLPVVNGVTTVSRVIAPVTRLFSVFNRGPISPLVTIGYRGPG